MTSAPDASVLTIACDGSADEVFVKVWAAGSAEPDDAFPPSPLDDPVDPVPTTTVSAPATTAPEPEAAAP